MATPRGVGVGEALPNESVAKSADFLASTCRAKFFATDEAILKLATKGCRGHCDLPDYDASKRPLTVITSDDCQLQATGDDAWGEFRAYCDMTRYGLLVIIESKHALMEWIASNALEPETEGLAQYRLWVLHDGNITGDILALAVLFGLGYDLPNGDFHLVKTLYERDAALGKATAMNHLAHREKDPLKKREWYEKAAHAGSVSAMFILAREFEEDKDCKRKWYEMAAKTGDIDARSFLRKLDSFGVAAV